MRNYLIWNLPNGSVKIPILKSNFLYYFKWFLILNNYLQIRGIVLAGFMCKFMCILMSGIKCSEIFQMDPLKSICKSQNTIILIFFLVILNNFLKIMGIFLVALLCKFKSSFMRRINWYEISSMYPLKYICKSQNSIILIHSLVILKFR